MKIQNAEQVLGLLIASGAISMEDISKVQEHTIDYQRTLDLFHTIFCIHDHPGTCKYCVEEQLDNAMKRPYHIEWSNKMVNFMESCGMDSHNDLLKALVNVTQSMPQYYAMCIITALGVGLDNFTDGMATELLSVVPTSSELPELPEPESSEESDQ